MGPLPAGRRQPLDGARGAWAECGARYPPSAGSGRCPDAGHPSHTRAMGECRQQPLPRSAYRGAQLVEASGVDHRPWLGDADEVLDAIESFLTGTSARPRTGRYAAGAEALTRREREIVALHLRRETAPAIAVTVSQRAHRGEPSRPCLCEARRAFKTRADPAGSRTWPGR